jgi:hypothetical protein
MIRRTKAVRAAGRRRAPPRPARGAAGEGTRALFAYSSACPPPRAQARAQRKRDSFASLLGDTPPAAQADSRGPHEEGGAQVGRAGGTSKHAQPIGGGSAGKRLKPALVKQRGGALSSGQPAGAAAPFPGATKRGRDASSAPAPGLKKHKSLYAPVKAPGPPEASRRAPHGAKPRSRVDCLATFSAALKM